MIVCPALRTNPQKSRDAAPNDVHTFRYTLSERSVHVRRLRPTVAFSVNGMRSRSVYIIARLREVIGLAIAVRRFLIGVE